MNVRIAFPSGETIFLVSLCHPRYVLILENKADFLEKETPYREARNPIVGGRERHILSSRWFRKACGFYSSSNVLRIKCELGGVGIHSVHLLWGFKGERLEEARTGAMLQLLWSNPQAFEEINTRKGALLRRKNYVWSTPKSYHQPHGIAPSALLLWSGFVNFFFQAKSACFSRRSFV